MTATLVTETVMFAHRCLNIRESDDAARQDSGHQASRRRDGICLVAGFWLNANGTPPPSITALWIMAIPLGAFTLLAVLGCR